MPDIDKIKNGNNAPVKLDSTQALTGITKQKLQELYDISALYTSGNRNTAIDSLNYRQIQGYFIKKDSGNVTNLFKELDSLKVRYVKIKNVEIIVVNTCFEYWLLLHFKYSKKQFSDCDQTQKELEKVFKGYQKTGKFYKQENNIYNQLKDKLPDAVINASKLGNFDIKNPNKPVCEIYKLFNLDGTFNTNL